MFYLLDKKAGPSSHDAVKEFAKLVNATKVGHAGTLDPFATGLLLVATDDDTPLLAYADRDEKTYDVTMRLGATSTTQDLTGTISVIEGPMPSTQVVYEAINDLVNVTTQVPPQYSAKQVNGQRAYALARQGISVDLDPIFVRVIDVTNIKFIDPSTYEFSISVSRGTYIRALVHHLGMKLNCGAITWALRRTAIGELDQSLLSSANYVQLQSSKVVLLPPLDLNAHRFLIDGKKAATKLAPGEYALVADGEIYGVAQVENKVLSAKRMLGKKLALLKNDR